MRNKAQSERRKAQKLENEEVKVEGIELRKVLEKLYLPPKDSHKGQNGRLLVIGGSRLFHAASIWAARIASYFVDIVHYSSTRENNQVFLSLKKKFLSGIVVEKKDLLSYIEEDDCVLIGPGMVRGKVSEARRKKLLRLSFSSILKLKNEAEYTFALVHFLLKNFTEKRFVIDAGALQMLEVEALKGLKKKPILTPHKKEFERVFGINADSLQKEEFIGLAKEFNCVILLKRVEDWITDGESFVKVKGGNAGLAKGGTGDVLAGLVSSFYTKNGPLISAVLASYFVKSAAYQLFERKAYWYNIDDIIEAIPEILARFLHGL